MMAARDTAAHHYLGDLLQGLATVPAACRQLPVQGLATDSRQVQPGYLFFAVNRPQPGNLAYINAAVRAGALAILAEESALPENTLCPLPLIRIDDLHAKTGIIAARFYNQPAQAMSVIGVTGTNGKSSVSHILAHSLSLLAGSKTALIGTLGYGLINALEPGPNTTPDAIRLQALLADMQDQQAKYTVLEVSSHGIDQERIAGVQFGLGILTNVSRDHLDYHHNMENYVAVKRRFFTDYGINRVALNLDDNLGRELAQSLSGKVDLAAYSLARSEGEYPASLPLLQGQLLQQQLGSMQLEITSPWGNGTLQSHLFGRHNASNLLAALAGLCLLGMPWEESLRALAACPSVPGRLQCFQAAGKATAVVDYAHTPDALLQVLQTLKPLCNGRLICVFGCGGERDHGKRAEMGAVAARYADDIVLTNDNPRREDPAAILADIEKGIGKDVLLRVIPDRRQAITAAIQAAGVDDIILVAGKGHEDYQDIAGQKRPFSDQAVIREAHGERT